MGPSAALLPPVTRTVRERVAGAQKPLIESESGAFAKPVRPRHPAVMRVHEALLVMKARTEL